MVSGVGAYQQTVNLQQLSQQTNTRDSQTPDVRESDRDRDDVQVSRTRDAALTRLNEDDQSRNEQKFLDIENMPTQAAGKEAGLRRGSLLDVTA